MELQNLLDFFAFFFLNVLPCCFHQKTRSRNSFRMFDLRNSIELSLVHQQLNIISHGDGNEGLPPRPLLINIRWAASRCQEMSGLVINCSITRLKIRQLDGPIVE